MNRMLVFLFAAILPALALAREPFPLRADGSIPLWTVAGPLPNAPIMDHGDRCVGFYQDYLEKDQGEAAATPAEGDSITLSAEASINWTRAFSEPSGLLNYNRIFSITEEVPAVAYAFCWLVSDAEQDVVLKIRSNDGVRVWLNSDRVHENHVGRTIEASEDSVPVRLKKGDNRLLVKVDQSGGGWGLLLRVVAPEGQAAAGVRSAVSLETPLAGSLIGASFTGTPFVRKTPDGESQILVAQITSGGMEALACRIETEGWAEPHAVDSGRAAPGRASRRDCRAGAHRKSTGPDHAPDGRNRTRAAGRSPVSAA